MRRFVCLLAVSLSLASIASAADTQLFTTKSFQRSTLGQVAGQEMVWGPTYKSVQVINFNDGALLHRSYRQPMSSRDEANFQAEINSAPEVNFQIDGVNYRAFQSTFEYRGDGDYSWFGKVAGSEFLSHFNVYKSATAGEIWLPGNLNRLILSRGGETCLVEMDDHEISRGLANDQILSGVSLVHEKGSLGTRASSGGVRLGGGNTVTKRVSCGAGEVLAQQIDLLYVYDQSVIDVYHQYTQDETEIHNALYSILQNSVDALNGTIVNSKPGAYYHVNLVGIEKVNYTSVGQMGDDLDWLEKSPQVATIRDSKRADVIGFWVGQAKSGSAGMSDGFYGERFAHHISYIGGGVTVAVHEFGHTLGMFHQPEDPMTPSDTIFRGNFVDGAFREAVSIWTNQLCPHGCPVVPIFANPAVFANGYPTGITNQRENWKALVNFSAVSKYRVSGNELACVAVQ